MVWHDLVLYPDLFWKNQEGVWQHAK